MELQDLYGSTTTARESGMLFPSQSEEVWYWVSLILTRPGAVTVLSQHAAGGQAGLGSWAWLGQWAWCRAGQKCELRYLTLEEPDGVLSSTDGKGAVCNLEEVQFLVCSYFPSQKVEWVVYIPPLYAL